MTTAIIGVGKLGTSVARDLVDGGERVVLAAHDGANATALARELGEPASVASVEKAIGDADVVVFAVWLDTLKDLITQHADLLKGAAGYDPVKASGIDAAVRIETSGDLHQFGGLNGRVVDTSEAQAALAIVA